MLKEVPSDPNTPVYFCPECHAAYKTPRGAEWCAEARNELPLFSPGDIVTIEQGYGWHDDNAWVKDQEGHEFHGEKTFRFYYVVTAVHPHHREKNPRPFRDPDDHSAHLHTYSVRSKAAGANGGPKGWNSIEGHHPMTLAENPPAEVVEESKEFVGDIYTNLL